MRISKEAAGRIASDLDAQRGGSNAGSVAVYTYDGQQVVTRHPSLDEPEPLGYVGIDVIALKISSAEEPTRTGAAIRDHVASYQAEERRIQPSMEDEKAEDLAIDDTILEMARRRVRQVHDDDELGHGVMYEDHVVIVTLERDNDPHATSPYVRRLRITRTLTTPDGETISEETIHETTEPQPERISRWDLWEFAEYLAADFKHAHPH